VREKYVKYLKSEKGLRQDIPDFKERVEALLYEVREVTVKFKEKRSRLMEKTKNRIIIENPPKKVLDFVMKVQKEKEEARKHLLEKKEHTFSIQM
jgi:hypothetical protein